MIAHQVYRETARESRGCPASGNPGFLEVWARCAPIRLAGYEDDLAEPHILQGID